MLANVGAGTEGALDVVLLQAASAMMATAVIAAAAKRLNIKGDPLYKVEWCGRLRDKTYLIIF